MLCAWPRCRVGLAQSALAWPRLAAASRCPPRCACQGQLASRLCPAVALRRDRSWPRALSLPLECTAWLPPCVAIVLACIAALIQPGGGDSSVDCLFSPLSLRCPPWPVGVRLLYSGSKGLPAPNSPHPCHRSGATGGASCRPYWAMAPLASACSMAIAGASGQRQHVAAALAAGSRGQQRHAAAAPGAGTCGQQWHEAVHYH
jgi:hypothetical protein